MANGEILGMSLLLEDILQTGDYSFSLNEDRPKTTNADGGEASTSAAGVDDTATTSMSTSKLSIQLRVLKKPTFFNVFHCASNTRFAGNFRNL